MNSYKVSVFANLANEHFAALEDLGYSIASRTGASRTEVVGRGLEHMQVPAR